MRRLDDLEYRIFKRGLFLVFVVTFGDFLYQKIWPVLGRLLK